jgi:predicted esterase
MVNFLKDVAEKHQFLVGASRKFRNNIDRSEAFSDMAKLVNDEKKIYPINYLKVITLGHSGGGMAAHMFSVSYPNITWAVITNCGRIHPDFHEKERHLYARNKLAVFLVSPSDFNYEYMREDRRFLKGLGWKTKWIEFKGGHRMAPKEKFEEAIQWLENQI